MSGRVCGALALALAAVRSVELAGEAAQAREILQRLYPDMRSALEEARETDYDLLLNMPVLRALGLELPPGRPPFLGEAYFDLLRRGLAASGRRDLAPPPPGRGEILVEPWPGAPEPSEAILDSDALGRPAARFEELGARPASGAREYNAVFGVGLVPVVVETDGERRGALAPVEVSFRFESGAEPARLEQEFASACREGMDGAFEFCASRSSRTPGAGAVVLAGLVACAILAAAYAAQRVRRG